MSTAIALSARSAFADVLPQQGALGVSVIERDGMGLATIQVRKDAMIELGRRVRQRYGIELPLRPSRATSGEIGFAGTAPGAWLATHESGGNPFAASLVDSLGDVAAVTDQSDGLGVLRLAGPRVRDLLSRLVPVDVHARSFAIGDVAATISGHIAVTLWRAADEGDQPAFEIALARSFAASFARMLAESLDALAVSPS
jgi:methylglutamate dehydrogenase subunit D